MKTRLDKINERLSREIQYGNFQKRVLEVTKNHRFFAYALTQFSFVVVPDGVEELDEPNYGCVMRESRYVEQIVYIDDIVVQFLHTAMHEGCRWSWYRARTPKETFTPIELDVLEEIYSQYIIYNINPDIHDWFPDSIRRYLKYKSIEQNEVTDQMFFLLENNDTSSVFRKFIDSLYSTTPNERTFSQYISTCEELLIDFGLRKLIQDYDDVLNGKCE